MADPISNLEACTTDVYRAEKASPGEPTLPDDYGELMRRLNVARVTLPSEHRDGAADPFRETLLTIGPEGFQQVLQVPPGENETCNGLLLRDIAQALLERAPTPAEEEAGPEAESLRAQARARREATDAFQEVVFDLYDTFLNPQWRRFRPGFSRLPPIVKWGNPDGYAPYAWDATAALPFFGVESGVVSLPPAYAQQGLLGWAAIGHECSGHDILTADAGLSAEIERVLKTLTTDLAPVLQPLGEYWLQRWDEAASDLLAIMNMGPTAAVALLGYFRARRRARGEPSALACVDELPGGSHPIDILRAAAWVASVRKLAGRREEDAQEAESEGLWDRAKELRESERQLKEWANVLEGEAVSDIKVVGAHLPDQPNSERMIKLKISPNAEARYTTWQEATDTADKLLEALDQQYASLGGARLRDFSDWTLEDEKAVKDLWKFLVDKLCAQDDEFADTIDELANLRARLRFEEGYGRRKNEEAIKRLRDDLDALWKCWSLNGLWAAHVVAAANQIALAPPGGCDQEVTVKRVFARMKKLLAYMHNQNRRWGAPEGPNWPSEED